MQTSILFDGKNIGFFEIYGVSTRTRGVEAVRTFYGQGGGVKFFAILCGLLYGRPLSKILKPVNIFQEMFNCTILFLF